jgi:hypothetical protein
MVVMGAALVAVILISLVNLIADICQSVLDPRAHVTLCFAGLSHRSRRASPRVPDLRISVGAGKHDQLRTTQPPDCVSNRGEERLRA